MSPVTVRPNSWNRSTDSTSEVPKQWRRDNVNATIAEDLDRLSSGEEATEIPEPSREAWGEVAGWALNALARLPIAPPSRDAVDCLSWLGDGADLEWFEAPDLAPLDLSLRPHERGRHLVDVYGLQERIDRARTRFNIDQRRRSRNRGNARALRRG